MHMSEIIRSEKFGNYMLLNLVKKGSRECHEEEEVGEHITVLKHVFQTAVTTAINRKGREGT